MGCFRKHLKSQRGFTLLELLIALSLLGGIVGVIYSIQSFTMKTFAQGAHYAAMQLEARFISAYLSGRCVLPKNCASWVMFQMIWQMVLRFLWIGTVGL